jgi:multiple sugar transport system substrate-binding protein
MDRDLSLFSGFASADVSRRDFLKRTGYTGLTALGAGSLLAACGGSSTTSQSTGIAAKGAKVSGNLTLVYLGTADQQKAWNSLFDLFRKKYPDVTLKAKGIPLDNWAAFFDTVSTQIAGGQNYDVIQVATEGQRLFASRGLVEPVDAYLERDKDELAEFFSDIHPNLIKWNKDNSPDGKTYYLPGEFNTMCLWYNVELFQKAGVTEPTNDWKWDDFLTIAQKLTKPGQTFGMNIPAAYFAGIMPWLLTNGASTLDAAWKNSTVNTPAAIEATKFMVSMVSQKISPPPGGTFDQFTAAAQGKLAMFGGGRWPIITIRDLNAVNKMKIVAWPQKTQKGSPIGWNGYPIMKASQNKEAAWAFVKFITSKEASTFFSQQGGTIVPPRKSVATSDAFLSNAPAGTENLYAALDYATPIPSPDKGNIIQKDIEDTWGQMLAGNTPVEQGLAQLDQKIKANL